MILISRLRFAMMLILLRRGAVACCRRFVCSCRRRKKNGDIVHVEIGIGGEQLALRVDCGDTFSGKWFFYVKITQFVNPMRIRTSWFMCIHNGG